MNRIAVTFKAPLAALLLVLALVGSAHARPTETPLETRLERALAVPGVSPKETAALAIDLATGAIVYGLNEAEPLLPASNQKLALAVAAFMELGPAFTFETDVLGEGYLDRTVWHGDLVLKGYGDPTLSDEDLAELARQVRAAGIRRVSGSIVGDESFFDRRRTAPGWKPSFYKEESPPLSALVVDRARVGGKTVDDPALAAAAEFRLALEAAGVRVPGAATTGRADASAVPIAHTASRELRLIVRAMNRRSDNFIAETLMKQLGARELGRGSTAAGALVVRRVLRERGVPLEGVRIVDGSGLSRHDRLTARALAALLVSVWSDSALRGPFVNSLPLAGVSGTLEDRMEKPPARGLVRAKTGTTSTASTLAGYVGDRYVFVVLQNGRPIPWWRAQRGQDRFVQLLAAQ